MLGTLVDEARSAGDDIGAASVVDDVDDETVIESSDDVVDTQGEDVL